MENGEVEIINSGVKITDIWDNICEFCREIEDVLEEFVSDSEEIEDFDDWRPREDESTTELKERTAEQASLRERKVEEDFEGAEKELSKASEKVSNSVKEIVNNGKPGKELKDASKKISNLIEAESLGSIRKMEKAIYKKFVLKFTPYYFDTEDLSINLEKNGGDKYTLTVNILDEEAREEIQQYVERVYT